MGEKRCARCNELVKKFWNTEVNGVPIGPKCLKRFRARVRLRTEGEGDLEVSQCEVCQADFLFRQSSVNTCGKKFCCLHCPLSKIKEHGEYCQLEVVSGCTSHD